MEKYILLHLEISLKNNTSSLTTEYLNVGRNQKSVNWNGKYIYTRDFDKVLYFERSELAVSAVIVTNIMFGDRGKKKLIHDLAHYIKKRVDMATAMGEELERLVEEPGVYNID